VTEVDVGVEVDQPLWGLQVRDGNFQSTEGYPPIVVSALPSGEAKVAWTAKDGTVHVTPLTPSLQRKGPDAIIAATEAYYSPVIRGFVAHEDGGAILVSRPAAATNEWDLTLVRFDDSGQELFATSLNDEDDSVYGRTTGRLVWTGTQYMAYFAIGGTAGFSQGHQGDKLKVIDANGAIAGGGWEWGCSHSLDQRLEVTSKGTKAICVSDSYPSTGIVIDNGLNISPEPGNAMGDTDATLGGAVERGDTFYVLFSAKQAGAWDIALGGVQLTSNTPIAKTWLTSTPVMDGNPKLVAYGPDGMLAAWASPDDANLGQLIHTAQLLDASGQPVGGPETLPVPMGALDDLRTLPSGDVFWAYSWDDLTKLKIVRMAYCQ
jgi:hypothetical protein